MDATVLQSQIQEPDVARLVLQRDQLAKFRRIKFGDQDSDAAFAERIGLDPGQVSRVLSGKSAPGTRFIAGCLEVFGIECFADFFAIEPDDDEAVA